VASWERKVDGPKVTIFGETLQISDRIPLILILPLNSFQTKVLAPNSTNSGKGITATAAGHDDAGNKN